VWPYRAGFDVVTGLNGVIDDETAECNGIVLVDASRPSAVSTIPDLDFFASIHFVCGNKPQ